MPVLVKFSRFVKIYSPSFGVESSFISQECFNFLLNDKSIPTQNPLLFMQFRILVVPYSNITINNGDLVSYSSRATTSNSVSNSGQICPVFVQISFNLYCCLCIYSVIYGEFSSELNFTSQNVFDFTILLPPVYHNICMYMRIHMYICFCISINTVLYI